MPVEETLALAPGAAAVLMLARAWLTVRLRRRSDPEA
jgi:hypothetical protein